MRNIKEILRLHFDLNRSQHEISQSLGISRSTIRDYLARAKVVGLSWPLPNELTEEALRRQLFPGNTRAIKAPQPDWANIHQELKQKGMTLQLLWEEYKKQHPNGYQYSWFALRYRQWSKTLNVWMPQTYQAGDKIFVDYSGLTVPIWSISQKEIAYKAEIFVGVLGASDFIFCCASATQKLDAWIEAHCRMFEYFEGSCLLLVPDNLRSAVSKAHRYEPRCHQTYEDMARYYNSAIMPARVRRPQDKSKAEKSVQIVQQRILSPLRHQKMASIDQLNEKIAPLLEDLNTRPFQKLPYSRRDLFHRVEKKMLQPLPSTRYEMGEWFQETLKGSYHVCIFKHYYSIPYTYVGKKIDVCATARVIDCFYRDQRIATHRRQDTSGQYTTLDAHRPEAHRQQALWCRARLQAWATGIGNSSHQLIEKVLQDASRHLEQRERSALGILRLSHQYTEMQLEVACRYALQIGTTRYDSLVSILKHNLTGNDQTQTDTSKKHHKNLRGAKYYH